MTSQQRTFSPDEFTKRLKAGDIAAPLVLTGLVKDDDTAEDILMFSMDMCGSWTAIPHSLIDQVELLKHVKCKDHEHPLVNLHLKQSDHPEVRAALSLLANMPKAKAPTSPDPGTVAPDAHWLWWLTDTDYEECARCVNGCTSLSSPEQRKACLRRCPC